MRGQVLSAERLDAMVEVSVAEIAVARPDVWERIHSCHGRETVQGHRVTANALKVIADEYALHLLWAVVAS